MCKPTDGDTDGGLVLTCTPMSSASMGNGRSAWSSRCVASAWARAMTWDGVARRPVSHVRYDSGDTPRRRSLESGRGQVETQHPEDRRQEAFSLPQGQVEDEPERQRGFDGEIGILQLPATLADPHGLPSGDRIRGQPHGDIAALDQRSVVCRPIPDVVFCLVLWVHTRLHVAIMHLLSPRWPGGRSWLTEGAGSVHQRRDSLSEFMRRLGIYSTSGDKHTRLRNQMKRLFYSQIVLVYKDAHGERFVNSPIADSGEFWWDAKHPSQASLWESKIQLGERFFHEIITNPLPINMKILKAMKRSPLGLDLYLWLTYRTFKLTRPMRLTWTQLYRQFGVNPARATDQVTVDNFRRDCLRELKKIKHSWPDLHYRMVKGALLLSPSPPAIAPSQLRLVE